MSNDTPEPRRNGLDGEYVCTHCGGEACNLLGGEHIWKCSEIVTKAELRDIITEFREERERSSEDNALATGIAIGYDGAADRLEELL